MAMLDYNDFNEANKIAHCIIESNQRLTEWGWIDNTPIFNAIRGKSVEEVYWLILRSRAHLSVVLTGNRKVYVDVIEVEIPDYVVFNSNTARIAAGMLVDYCKAYDEAKGRC